MKQLLISFLLFLILPTSSWAFNDSCSKPSEYTIDQRCYVTDAQKNEKPYSAVVAVLDGDKIACAGTIAKADDGSLYMHTTKHCVVDINGSAKGTVKVRTQDGKTLVLDVSRVGKYKPAKVYSGDSVIYVLPHGTDFAGGEKDWVDLVDGVRPNCRGNLVKDDDGDLLLYVDKGCVIDRNGVVENTVHIRDKNNEIIEIAKINEFTGRENVMGDWAVYLVPEEYDQVAWVKITSAVNGDMSFGTNKLIGYSSLKIMSDAEIEDFKQKYVKYLNEKKGMESDGTEKVLGWQNGGINFNTAFARDMMFYLKRNDGSYYRDIFEDSDKLKYLDFQGLSGGGYGAFSGWGSMYSWSSSSGAGVFDKYGDFCGIHNQDKTTMGMTNERVPNEGIGIRSLYQ